MPLPAFTCGGCDREWTGLNYAHCSVCHETFAGAEWFDRHRLVGRGEAKGRCQPPGSMTRKDGKPVLRNDQGVWRNAARDSRDHASISA